MPIRRTFWLLATALLAAACTPTLVNFAPRVHIVQSGETLFSIAWRYQLDVRELVLWNELDNPDLILVGQRLFLTPEGQAETQAANVGRPPVVPRVSSGQTGPAQAETRPLETRQPVTESPAVATDSDDGSDQSPADESSAVESPAAESPVAGSPAAGGQQAAGSVASTAVPTPIPTPVPTPSAPSAPTRTTAGSMGAAPASPEPSEASRPPPAPAAQPPSLAVLPAPPWQWPIRGPVVSAYGAAQGTGSGIGIGGQLGADIRASAPGQVVYAGDGLAAYGNLIIIKHNDTFLSAYGHNDALVVGEGDAVQQGDVIARMGMGPERQPQVHFEIRRNGTPVDPLGHLPN